jgi:hypothetical protein
MLIGDMGIIGTKLACMARHRRDLRLARTPFATATFDR